MTVQRQSESFLALESCSIVATTGKSGVMYWADGGNLYRARQDGTVPVPLFAIDSPVGDVRYVPIDTAVLWFVFCCHRVSRQFVLSAWRHSDLQVVVL